MSKSSLSSTDTPTDGKTGAHPPGGAGVGRRPGLAPARHLRGFRLAAAVAGLALLIPCIAPASDSASPGSFKLIVHSATAGSRIPRAVVAAIFLRQVANWGDGAPIEVLDRSLTSPERVAFGSQVLGMTTLEMNQYWIRQMSRGTIPPSVEESDEAVVAFVASTPGAISYVAGDTPTPPEVKVVQID